MMSKKYFTFLLALCLAIPIMAQGQLQPFKDNAEFQPDFGEDNLIGWTSLDLDEHDTNGPTFNDFPGKGEPHGFMIYNPNETDPVNELDGFPAYSGEKYFVSIASYDGPVNDWLISEELDTHAGGTFSFYAKSSATYAGPDEFKIAYSTTTSDPEDFIFLNDGNTESSSDNWVKFEYDIPEDANHLAINSVTEAVMLMVDAIEFKADIEDLAPGVITNFTKDIEVDEDVEVTFSWENPSHDYAGNELTNLTGVRIYRGTHPMNLTEIADLSSIPGEAVSYIDNVSEGDSYIHRFVPYNETGDGELYTTSMTTYGSETVPGAPANISFTQNENLQTVFSWEEVDYGEMGGALEEPVIGYTILRSLGNETETLAEMHESTSYVETEIPELNLYNYTIIAQTSPDNLGESAVVPGYSGLTSNQVSVTSGNEPSEQPFELSRSSIISQSIYTPDEFGDSGLITSLSYFANMGAASSAHYKIYMSFTENDTFGTNLDNAIWEYFGDQKLLFDGDIEFPEGRNSINIELDQPFYYDDSNNENVIITIVKPLLENTPSINPIEFLNTEVDGMRTYYTIGYTVDLSLISNQPASWATEEVTTIPSVVIDKTTDYSSLEGLVTNLEDDSPLDEVTVTISPDNSETYQTDTTITNQTGEYTIPAILPGDYVVTFTKNGFNPVEMSLTIDPDEQLAMDVGLEPSLPISISGTVVDAEGDGIEGVNLNLEGFSEFTTTSDADGEFTLEAFSEKEYELEATHPLYHSESISFTSEEGGYDIDPIILDISLHKPRNVFAVNNQGTGEISWETPVGYYNETMLGWGSYINAGNSWGNGTDPFIAGIRFETSDLEDLVNENAELTHVKAYIKNNAEIIIRIYEGENGGELIHSQPASIEQEDWYMFELNQSLPIDVTKELWIGIEFLGQQYGAYPMGIDGGPNVTDKKGSMLYQNEQWVQMSLNNNNWNIYGIANNSIEADPSGYAVYRSPASEDAWIELTSTPATETSFNDASLSDADPGLYEYGIAAEYGGDLTSDKAISNEIEVDVDDCPAPIDITVFNIEGNTADVSWTPTGNETKWEVLFGEVGFTPDNDEGQSVIVNDNPEVILEGLEIDREYDVYVRALCDDENVSDWTGPEIFLDIEDEMFEDFVFYPNPVEGQLVLKANSIIESVSVFNLLDTMFKSKLFRLFFPLFLCNFVSNKRRL